MTRILVENAKTGANEIKTLPYELPSYSIGMTIAFAVEGVEVESIIDSIQFIVTEIEGETVCQITYLTVDGYEICEEQVLYYYPED